VVRRGLENHCTAEGLAYNQLKQKARALHQS
jgi:hypothetical protein